MFVINHKCGHTQATNLDKHAEKAHLLGKPPEQFLKEQREWLEANLCPGCYCAAKEVSPNLKPNDPHEPRALQMARDVAEVISKL